MEFWIFFSSVIFIIWWMGINSLSGYERTLGKIIMIIIWLVASFRYMIGADYYLYLRLYELAIRDDPFVSEYVEPSFFAIANFIDYMGFSTQMLFIIYESIIVFFIYKGFSYFCSIKKSFIFTIIFYVYYYYGFWYSMNNIRASAALAILFWSTKFVCKKEIKKFFVSVIIATFFHYSAILYLPVYFLSYAKMITLKTIVIGAFFSLFGGYMTIFTKIFSWFMQLTEYGEKYLYILGNIKGEWFFSSNTILVVMLFMIIVIYRKEFHSDELVLLFNMSCIYLFVDFFTGIKFDNTTLMDLVSRVKLYFLLPFLTIAGITISMLQVRRKMLSFLMVFLLAINFCRFINYVGNDEVAKAMTDSLSQGNIRYNVNVKIFK